MEFREDVRDIRYIESEDFVHWSEQQILRFDDGEDIPLYTNGSLCAATVGGFSLALY